MQREDRRLAAIVAADIAGYSRLIGLDEEGTLRALRAHRRELIDQQINRHGGRIANTAGDSLLLEFPSVVHAVRCALDMQDGMAERNRAIRVDRRIEFRVGINLGDVIAEGDDLMGDGVNIAARLQELSAPGGLVLSRAAHEQVRDKLELAFEDMGEVAVKNIARPVRAFRLTGEGDGAALSAAAPVMTRWPARAAFAALVIVLAVGSGMWWWHQRADDKVAPAGGNPVATADTVLALPKGPKIVVLPLDNISGNKEQEYFVDGLTEDLTTRLSQLGYLSVIARNSAFKYKGKSPDVRDVGRDLGVDYVVEGSVRRSGDSIRVNVQLLKTEDGTHVWAQTYDRKLDVDGVFGIQDELAIGISESIGGTGGAVSKPILRQITSKRPSDLASFECVLLSWYYSNTLIPSVHAKARDCLEFAVKRDPSYAPAWAELANVYRQEHYIGVNPLPNSIERGLKAVDQAIKIDPNLSDAHVAHANLSFDSRRKEDALSSIERALVLAPNRPLILQSAAFLLIRFGQWDRSMALWRKASALDPSPPSWTLWVPMHVHHQRGELEKAHQYILRIKQQTGNWWGPHSFEAILLAELGREDEARKAMARALQREPNLVTVAPKLMDIYWWSQPKYLERAMAAGYKAGLGKPAKENQ